MALFLDPAISFYNKNPLIVHKNICRIRPKALMCCNTHHLTVFCLVQQMHTAHVTLPQIRMDYSRSHQST